MEHIRLYGRREMWVCTPIGIWAEPAFTMATTDDVNERERGGDGMRIMAERVDDVGRGRPSCVRGSTHPEAGGLKTHDDATTIRLVR